MLELKELMNHCIEKWNNGMESDKRIKEVEKYFEEWFSNIPEKYKSMVEILIKNLEYYPRRIVNKYLEDLHKELLEKGNISDENTIYVFIKTKSGVGNSSNDYWTEYKNINELNREICYEDMSLINDEQWKYIENIVFIDDFCGTGKTFINEIKKFKERYNGKKIFYIVIVTAKKGLEKINIYSKDNNLLINLLPKFTQEKIFEQNLFDNNESAKQLLIRLSEEFKIQKFERLGYDKSESLVAFYNNTPNNTIGLMRYDTDIYKSLFPRKNDKKPLWKTMKKDEKERKMTNYNNKVEKGKKYE
ncbi:phosphoribosyltransferase-like protein [Fusobacterium vincentii]|uniref:phosphoribosyltransferase-like protein n=1 Tax=Fusobacterium vincentii TaxID=155615 RepID=UPI002B2C9BE1|nr:hypothetical protein FVTDC_17080 [Fusobacterium vincentii]